MQTLGWGSARPGLCNPGCLEPGQAAEQTRRRPGGKTTQKLPTEIRGFP